MKRIFLTGLFLFWSLAAGAFPGAEERRVLKTLAKRNPVFVFPKDSSHAPYLHAHSNGPICSHFLAAETVAIQVPRTKPLVRWLAGRTHHRAVGWKAIRERVNELIKIYGQELLVAVDLDHVMFDYDAVQKELKEILNPKSYGSLYDFDTDPLDTIGPLVSGGFLRLAPPETEAVEVFNEVAKQTPALILTNRPTYAANLTHFTLQQLGIRPSAQKFFSGGDDWDREYSEHLRDETDLPPLVSEFRDGVFHTCRQDKGIALRLLTERAQGRRIRKIVFIDDILSNSIDVQVAFYGTDVEVESFEYRNASAGSSKPATVVK